MSKGASMSVTVLFILSFVILVGAAYLHFSKEGMYEKQMAESYDIVKKSNEGLEKKVFEMNKTLDLYGERFLVLEKELQVARQKADTADFIAHSAKMDVVNRSKAQTVKVEFSPIKMYQMPMRFKKKVKEPKSGVGPQKFDDAIIKKVKDKIAEINQ